MTQNPELLVQMTHDQSPEPKYQLTTGIQSLFWPPQVLNIHGTKTSSFMPWQYLSLHEQSTYSGSSVVPILRSPRCCVIVIPKVPV